MFDSHKPLLSTKMKSLLFSACLVGGVSLLTSCDSQSLPTDGNTAQMDKDPAASQTGRAGRSQVSSGLRLQQDNLPGLRSSY